MTGRSLDRRLFLAGCSALVATGRSRSDTPAPVSTLPIPAGNSLRFDVKRGGATIGHHQLTFTGGDGGALSVAIDVELAIYLGPIAVFRYKHAATETWQDGVFQGLTATTNDDGTQLRVAIKHADDTTQVDGTKVGHYSIPGLALAATHWNKHMLDGPFINTETGKTQRPTIAPGDWQMIPSKNDTTIKARPYVLTGDVALTTWYDESDNWVSIAFKADDGSEISYVQA